MKEPQFSPMAVEDLDGILEHIARDNPPAAIRFAVCRLAVKILTT